MVEKWRGLRPLFLPPRSQLIKVQNRPPPPLLGSRLVWGPSWKEEEAEAEAPEAGGPPSIHFFLFPSPPLFIQPSREGGAAG